MPEVESEKNELEPVVRKVAARGDERRTAERYEVKLDMTLCSDHNFYSGFAENISSGGVFVATHLLKPVGSQVELRLLLPKLEKEVRGLGEVRWHRLFNEVSNVPPGMGIRFIELEPGSVEAIQEFLSQREPLFFDDE